jgi:integrase
MTSLPLRYVQRIRDRHGAIRHYFRRPGYPRVTLPGEPGSPEFMEAYAAAMGAVAQQAGVSRTIPGSMSALAVSWYGSADFRHLAASTRRVYRAIVERFLALHGEKRVATLEPQHIRRILDARSAKPNAANRLRTLLRLLMRHAVEHGVRPDDPTISVRKIRYRKREIPTWTEEHIAAFEARWPPGTRARLALALLLYTGQRRSDVIRMGRQHVRGNAIEVVQQKTGTRLAIPIAPELAEAIAACPAEHLTFLMTELGAPFTSANTFGNWFTLCTRQAGIPSGLSAHGLRKAASRRLAQVGCSPHQIAAITGHLTLSEVERYTRAVDQERLARSAMRKVGRKRR